MKTRPCTAEASAEGRFRSEQETTLALLRLLNNRNQTQELIQHVTRLLQEWTGCEAVGVRLCQGEDFPYFETRGFPPEFVRAENSLCAFDQEGQLLRDRHGDPVLECMCGNVIRGRFDPALPFFTAKGSFWTNSMTELLAGTSESDRQARTRNRCHGEGYESVALIPLRSGPETIGLLQLNDHGRGRFTPDLIAFLEKTADQLAIALAQRRAQAALQESEERYRRLFEVESDAILLADRETERFLDVNPAALRLYGYTREEFLLLRARDVSAEPEETSRAIAAEQTFVALRQHRKKDGTNFPVEIAGSYFDIQGRKVHLAAIRDISERRQAEQKLKASDARLRLAAEATGFGAYSYDFVSDVGNWSPQFKRLLGLKPEEALPLDKDNLFVGLHPEDRAAFLAAMKAANDPGGDGLLQLDYRVLHPDGSIRWLQLHGLTTFAGESLNRRPDQAAGVVLDITKRKLAEEALRNSQRFAQSTIDALSAHLCVVNETGLILAVNKAWRDFARINSPGKINVSEGANYLSVCDAAGGPDGAAAAAGIRAVIGGQRDEFSLEYPCHSPAERRWFVARVSRFPGEGPVRFVIAHEDVTHLKRAEVELAQSQAQLLALVENTSDMVWSVDPVSFGLLSLNSGLKDYFRRTRGFEPRFGMAPKDLVPAGRVGQWQEYYARALREGSFVAEYPTVAGSHTLLLTFSVLKRGGEVFGISVFGKDITERKRAEEALRESELRLRQTASAGNVGLWDWDLATNRVLFSPEWKRQIGYQDHEVGNEFTEWQSRVHPDDLQRVMAQVRAYRAKPWPNYESEFRLAHKDGSYRWILAKASLLLDDTGRPCRMLGSHLDITERKQAEEALKLSEAKLRVILDTMSEGVALNEAIYNEAGEMVDYRIVAVNQAFYSTADCQPGPVVGNLATKLYGMSSEVIRAFWKSHKARDQVQHAEMISSRSHRCYSISTSPFHDGRFVTSFSDITERRRAEDALLASHEELRALAARVQTVREEERTRIAREIHDVLAQELTSLKIDLAVLTRLLDKPGGVGRRTLVREKLAEMATTADTAIRSVQKIATDLRPAVLDSLGLCAAVEWQVNDFQRRTGITCETRLPAGDLVVDRDRSTALFRILQESLTNVVRHAAATRVEVTLQREGEHIVLTVRDNGKGIQTSQAQAPGSVGLIGVRERALLLGGRCEITGRAGEGTTVVARVPVADGQK